MTKGDFINWFTTDCPSYLRLNPSAAEVKWKQHFQDSNILRDQVMANDLQGNPAGYVPCLLDYVRVESDSSSLDQ